MDNPIAYPLTEAEKETLQKKEMCVHGVPLLVLAKAGLFEDAIDGLFETGVSIAD